MSHIRLYFNVVNFRFITEFYCSQCPIAGNNLFSSGNYHTMKISCSWFTAPLLFLSTVLSAQQAQWEVYMGQYEKGPGSTIVDMSVKNIAPVKELPFLLVTGITFEKCTGDGSPEKDAFPQLYKVSDAVKPIIDAAVKNVFAGTFTYQCERLDYYYIKDTMGIREKLNR